MEFDVSPLNDVEFKVAGVAYSPGCWCLRHVGTGSACLEFDMSILHKDWLPVVADLSRTLILWLVFSW